MDLMIKEIRKNDKIRRKITKENTFVPEQKYLLGITLVPIITSQGKIKLKQTIYECYQNPNIKVSDAERNQLFAVTILSNAITMLNVLKLDFEEFTKNPVQINTIMNSKIENELKSKFNLVSSSKHNMPNGIEYFTNYVKNLIKANIELVEENFNNLVPKLKVVAKNVINELTSINQTIIDGKFKMEEFMNLATKSDNIVLK